MKKLSTLILFLILSFSISFSIAQETPIESAPSEVTFFHMHGCGACAQMKPFLEELRVRYNFSLNIYEISSRENSDLFKEYLERYNVPEDRRGYVPAVFIGDSFFIGFSPEITSAIENKISQGIPSENLFGGEIVQAKILGVWDVSFSSKNQPLIVTTLFLGFLDSLNVCSITVLIFLMTYTLSIGSLKRAFKLGLIFTIVIYLFYFLFMVVLTSLISALVMSYGFQIRILVILLSLFTGLLLIKDYFFYGRWFSLKVPDSAKPLMERYVKRGTVASTIIFAILVSLVELPCTAIFPLIYSTILAEMGITGISRILWIALYNLIYVLPLLLIVFGIYFSWTRIKDVDNEMQNLKRILKLIAGIALILISFYFARPLILG